MAPWLKQDDVRAVLRLHKSFDVDKEMGLSFDQILESRLPGLINPDQLTALKAYYEADFQPDNADLNQFRDPLKYFLIYAAYADYFLEGNVQITNSGPVQKEVDESSAITAQQRTELRVKYERLAAAYANELVALRTTSPCTPTYPASPQLTRVVGRLSTGSYRRNCW